jgi:hypothetical protein
MVNTVEIQLSLRAHLYGTKRVSNGNRNALEVLDTTAKFTSKQMISRLYELQCLIEFDTFARRPDSPSRFRTVFRILDVQNKGILMTHSVLNCCVITLPGPGLTMILRSFPSTSTFTWSPEDAVVVEAHGYVLIVPPFSTCS